MFEENVQYQLIPAEGADDNEVAWDVRILEGDFIESVIRFGNVAINEQKGMINFNFVVISSPDPDLTEENEELQEYVGMILQSVIDKSIKDGSAVIDERE